MPCPNDEPADDMSEFLETRVVIGTALTCAAGARLMLRPVGRAQSTLLFIDGDHLYEGCSADLTSWLPYVRCGDWIAFTIRRLMLARFAIFYPRSMRYSECRAWSIFVGRKR